MVNFRDNPWTLSLSKVIQRYGANQSLSDSVSDESKAPPQDDPKDPTCQEIRYSQMLF